MTDRQPTNAGRVKITNESDNSSYYATIEIADDPIVAGTPLNKANLLSDETARAIVPDIDDATVNDALARLNSKIGSKQDITMSLSGTTLYINF